jgi:hypothetical protein
MATRSRRRALVLAGAATAVSALGFGPFGLASAQAAGTFSCTGTALRIGATSYQVANPQDSPCATDLKLPVNATIPLGPLGFVQAVGLEAATQANHPTQPGLGHGGNAQAGLAGVTIRIAGQTITVGAVRTLLFTWCPTPDEGAATPPPMMTVQPESDLLGVQLNGRFLLNLNGPGTVPVGPYTLYVNRQFRTSNSLMQRALELQGPGLPVGGLVIGESKVDFTGNPCTAS